MKESPLDQGLKVKIRRRIHKMYFESYFYMKT